VTVPDRTRLLHGPYRQNRYRLGGVLFCEVRGEVVACGVSAGRIPWPVGKRGRAKSLVVCGGLVRAVRREAAVAVCHWWGITPQTVTKWRRALGVPEHNDGTRRLRRENAPNSVLRPDVQAKARANAQMPEARAKMGAANVGKPRPAHVRAAMNHRGRKASPEARTRMSAAHRRRGTVPSGTRVWSPAEDALLGLPTKEVTERTGRTVFAVWERRRRLRRSVR
jgi:hypothetical protein